VVKEKRVDTRKLYSMCGVTIHQTLQEETEMKERSMRGGALRGKSLKRTGEFLKGKKV